MSSIHVIGDCGRHGHVCSWLILRPIIRGLPAMRQSASWWDVLGHPLLFIRSSIHVIGDPSSPGHLCSWFLLGPIIQSMISARQLAWQDGITAPKDTTARRWHELHILFLIFLTRSQDAGLHVRFWL